MDLKPELIATIDELSALTDRVQQHTSNRLLFLIGTFDYTLPDRLMNECRRVFGAATQQHTLDVLLVSPGGLIDPAYIGVLVLRQYAETLRVLIPREAKSAATLFALGADSILMARTGHLGPLDAQVVDPRNHAVMMSALDGYQSVEYIRNYALETQHVVVRSTLDRTDARIPLSDILSHAECFVDKIVSPILAQVRPLDFGGWGRTLDIGKAYAKRLLERYGSQSACFAEQIAYNLVYRYPYHGFIIDLEEAMQLRLDVEPMDVCLADHLTSLVSLAKRLTRETSIGGSVTTEPGYVGFWPPEDLEQARELRVFQRPSVDVEDESTDQHEVAQREAAATQYPDDASGLLPASQNSEEGVKDGVSGAR